MKRSPVPEVNARSFCVSFSWRRVHLMRSPMSDVVVPILCSMFLYGNFTSLGGEDEIKYSRTGTSRSIRLQWRETFPNGNIQVNQPLTNARSSRTGTSGRLSAFRICGQSHRNNQATISRPTYAAALPLRNFLIASIFRARSLRTYRAKKTSTE